MAGPKNAGLSGDGGNFRFYEWAGGDSELNRQYGATQPVKVLSVTSIRKLCGESFSLVNWQLANIVNVAMGQRKIEWIGPRGGFREGYAPDGEFPGQFIQKLLATNGADLPMQDVRKWLRGAADEPRDFAAVRGTMVHEAIEMNVSLDRIDDVYIEAAISRLSARDKKKVKKGLRQEDRDFIRHAIGRYWHMREKVKYVILAREPQVWNLTAGYAGSADVLLWFLPDGTTEAERLAMQKLADQKDVTQAFIDSYGGHVCLGDYKTSKGVYTDQVVQVHAYLAAEFIGTDGVIDDRLSVIIREAAKGALLHIRPDAWAVDFVDFEEPVLMAFLGSCAFARFLAQYPDPEPLFKTTIKSSDFDDYEVEEPAA